MGRITEDSELAGPRAGGAVVPDRNGEGGGLAEARGEEDNTILDILSLGKWSITQKGMEVTSCRGFYIFQRTLTRPNIHKPLYSL